MKSFLTIAILIFIGISSSVKAQTSVTFNVNLKPELEDSTFVPGNDQLVITGNLYPFNFNKTYHLEDPIPEDSIYTIQIDFSSSQTGRSLEYNYIIRSENGDTRETMPRVIDLEKGDMTLRPHYFNAFAF